RTACQCWRLPMRRSGGRPEPGGAFYGAGDLRAVAAYAAERFVTIVPEVDSPGHTSALVRMHPELNTGRNQVEFELSPGHPQQAVWLDPELPTTFALIGQVRAGAAQTVAAPSIDTAGRDRFGRRQT